MSSDLMNKLKTLAKFREIYVNLSEIEVKLNSVKVNVNEENVGNIWDNNCGKMCRISTECKERIELMSNMNGINNSSAFGPNVGSLLIIMMNLFDIFQVI